MEYVEELECNCSSLLHECAAYIFAIQNLAPVFVRQALSVFDLEDNVYVYDLLIEYLTRYVTLDLLNLLLPGTRRFAELIRGLEPTEDTLWEAALDRLMETIRKHNEGDTGSVQSTNPLMRGVVAVVDEIVDDVLYSDPDAEPSGERLLMILNETEWIDRVAQMLARDYPRGERVSHAMHHATHRPGLPMSPSEEETVLPIELRDIAENLYTIQQTAQQSAVLQTATWAEVHASAKGAQWLREWYLGEERIAEQLRAQFVREIRAAAFKRAAYLDAAATPPTAAGNARLKEGARQGTDDNRDQAARFPAAEPEHTVETERRVKQVPNGTRQHSEISSDAVREQSGEKSGGSGGQSREQSGEQSEEQSRAQQTRVQNEPEESGYESEEDNDDGDDSGVADLNDRKPKKNGQKKTGKRRKMNEKDKNGDGKDDEERPSKRRRT
ncbi:hypothetical protein F503_04696 [Ophiostoma piceae UAMH 11346]|uniref:Uncharacterized protein n=1 Tax=Ophiostoma piceae (strain UAMH 11346) TaxID=1262450 RepID=S3BXK3_OPHP1|nr:hypothetical protein F503_04696 [Ophiostoma piceae UAMH 11346]